MHQSKNIEPQVANILIEKLGLKIEKFRVDPDSLSLNSFSEKIANIILDRLRKDGVSIVGLDIKPKVESEPTYGSKVEPKTDLVLFPSSGLPIKISLKKDTKKSYIHSSNNLNDNLSIFLGGGLGEEIPKELKMRIEDVFSRVLSKESNFDSYNKRKGSLQDYIDYYNNPEEIISWVGEDKYLMVREELIRRYSEVSSSGLRPYRTLLKTREGELQLLFEEIFRNEDNEVYARKILFELLTGSRKFGKDSLACSDYVANSEGIFMLDCINCDYITILLDHFRSSKKIGRLQNVPRVGNGKSDFMLEDIKEIAKKFPTADLTVKI
jgi:hypothetical protein